MAKTKSIKIKKGSVEKTVSQAQWDNMKANNATYGWMPASEVPKEVKTKEQQIELSQVQSLTKENNDLKAENESLKAENGSLKAQLSGSQPDQSVSVLDATLEDLPGELAKIEDVKVLESLKDAETKADNRKGALKAISDRIAALTDKK